MNKRTPKAEVISLAAYRNLRGTHHKPSLALEITRTCAVFVTGAEIGFAATYAKRLDETPTRTRHKAEVIDLAGYKAKRDRQSFQDAPFQAGDLVRVRDGIYTDGKTHKETVSVCEYVATLDTWLIETYENRLGYYAEDLTLIRRAKGGAR